jgi:hypothetical protein
VPGPAAGQALAQGDNGHDTISDLATLADLREKGVVSEAEFQQSKARILA